MEPDFGGYATRHNMKCSDGKTIMPGSFKHQDGTKVPLVWQHQYDSVDNVLGHGILRNRPDGVYIEGYFNDTPAAENAKMALHHRDIESLSIGANKIIQKNKNVLHGQIQEVSLVLSGANPGAYIDYVNLQHDDSEDDVSNGEAIIYTGLEIEHADSTEDTNEGATVAEETTTSTNDEKTVKDVIDSMTEEQKNVMYYMIGTAIEEESDDSDDDEENEDGLTQSDIIYQTGIQEGLMMSRNVFEKNDEDKRPTLTHAQIGTIVKDAERLGSFKESFLQHADEYGIREIETLFPDAKTLNTTPELIGRRTEWVNKVLTGTKHAPFSRIKSVFADITADEARAKGYIKGNQKKDEVIELLKRTTSPTTVYKKQRLDRDDILDITDFDVITWLKMEIRLMLDEELARAILVGDGRSSSDTDKIKDPQGSTDGIGIRSVANDHELYSVKVELPANTSPKATIEAVARARNDYRGSGSPTWYTTDSKVTDLLLLEDKMGRRLYNTMEELASVLRVKEIVTVEVLEEYPDILGIMVNLQDYTIGSDKGGELTFFDDFDIDFNQNKYLLETRVSGALTKPKSAIVIRRSSGTLVDVVTAPSFDGETNTITIPSTTGIDYMIDSEVVTGSVVITEDTEVMAVPADGYYFPSNVTTTWTYSHTEI